MGATQRGLHAAAFRIWKDYRSVVSGRLCALFSSPIKSARWRIIDPRAPLRAKLLWVDRTTSSSVWKSSRGFQHRDGDGMAPSTVHRRSSLSKAEVSFSDQRKQAEISECYLLQRLPESTSSRGKQGSKQSAPPNVGTWCPVSTHFEIRRLSAMDELSSRPLKSKAPVGPKQREL